MAEIGNPERDVLQGIIEAAEGGIERIESDHPVWDMARDFHRTAKDRPLTFDDRPFLEEIYKLWTSDISNVEISILKAPQEGISEWILCAVLTLAGEYGYSVFYVLPKYELRNAFVKSNVNRIIGNTQRYQTRINQSIGGVDSLQLKLMGRGGLIIFISANVEADFVAIPGDIGVIDEIDRCSPDYLGLLDDRLSAKSSKKVKVYISSPILKGRGISNKFEESDHRKWHVRCGTCGVYQELDWWVNVMRPVGESEYALIDQEWEQGGGRDIRVYCSGCHAEMDREGPGKWVVTRPENAGHYGFHISKLFSGASRVEEGYRLWRKGQEDPEVLQLFYNSFLGLPYDAPGAGLREEDLQACAALDPYLMPDSWSGRRTVLGCDVSKVLHVHITSIEGPHRRKLYVGMLPLDVQPLVDLFDRYKVGVGVIDAQPETKLVSDLKHALNTGGPIRLWSCHYSQSSLRDRSLVPEEARLTIDRTFALDQSFAEIRGRRVLLPSDWRGLQRGTFIRSMTEPKRIVEMRQGEPIWIWEKTDRDHDRHTDTYEWIASTLLPPECEADYSVPKGSGDRRVTKTTESSGFALGGTGGRIFQEGSPSGRAFP